MIVNLFAAADSMESIVALLVGSAAFIAAIWAIRNDTKSRNFSAVMGVMQEIQSSRDAVRAAGRSTDPDAMLEYELACYRYFNVLELVALTVNRNMISGAPKHFLIDYLCDSAEMIKRLPHLRSIWAAATDSPTGYSEMRKFISKHHAIIDAIRKCRAEQTLSTSKV